MAFAFVLLLLAVISWHRSNARKAAQPVGAVVPMTSKVSSAPSSASISYDSLLMLRRPRTIRMRTSIRIFATVYVFVLASVGYAVFLVAERGAVKTSFNNALPNLIPFAMFGLIWTVIAATMFRSILRDRSLLSDGEIAMATVVSQSFAGGESRDSRIAYEFKDAAGRTFSGKATDRTRKLFEEMRTPVFYDQANPEKNVALAGATYDVVDS
ncbi:MAG TPA: hypothetical protein VMP12_12195 [Candidatus Sulfotelmatobacter sp.]|nr:hypothetical protein [Candidatus Sulfotelmatobacter sp.]